MFVYVKILNLSKIGTFRYILGIVFAAILSFIVFILSEYIQYARYIIMILLLSGYTGYMTKTRYDLALTATIISTGISYGVYFISTSISAFFVLMISDDIYVIPMLIVAVMLQGLILTFLFKIKRFAKGITFLKKRGAGAIGLMISGSILMIIVLFDRGVSLQSMEWILVSVALCATGLIIWWRRGLTVQYREMVKERNISELEKIIAGKDALIEKLSKDNERMASLIHRDNKLLPSLSVAVLSLIDSDEVTKVDKESLSEQIRQLTQERINALKADTHGTDTTESFIDIHMINGIIKHMKNTAFEKGIQADAEGTDEIIKLPENLIPAINFYTILTDLTENAINAVSDIKPENDPGHVSVSFCFKNEIPQLCVSDNGILFKPETLLKLGTQKASTRLNKGGSGIGYITIFEILRECKAELIITEHEPKESSFIKSVTIKFNNKFDYMIESYRAEELYEIFTNDPAYTGTPEIINLRDLSS